MTTFVLFLSINTDTIIYILQFSPGQKKMGCGPSKKEVTAVQDATGMSKKEVSESFKQFKKEAGGAKIKLDKFTKLVASMNTNKGI